MTTVARKSEAVRRPPSISVGQVRWSASRAHSLDERSNLLTPRPRQSQRRDAQRMLSVGGLNNGYQPGLPADHDDLA